jgi:hypothetical protein
MQDRIWKKGMIYGIFFLLVVTTFPINTHANPILISLNEGTEYWALLIAGGLYADDPYSNFPEILEELDDLYDILLTSSCWSADHIKVIKGKDATVVNIIQGFGWLDKMDDSDDISLVYINTHGGQIPDLPPRDEADGDDEILVSYWGFAYPLTFISDDEINFFLNRLDSKGVCLIIDSCYAGGFNDTHSLNSEYREKGSFSKIENPLVVSSWIEGFAEDARGNNRVVMMSCRENEESWVPNFFTLCLIDGLRGYADNNMDGIVSAEELFSYIKPRIFLQIPIVYDDFPGELPLITLPKENTPLKVVDHLISRGGKFQWSIIKTNLLIDTPVVCGYIADNVTSNPIEHAFVTLYGIDSQGNNYENWTTTTTNGFYSLNVSAGSFFIVVSAEDYLMIQTNPYKIIENHLLWVNISLKPCPPMNSVVCGYITDAQNGEPLKSCLITLDWLDGQGHSWKSHTKSNDNGFYAFYSPAGEVYLSYYNQEYCYYQTYRNDVAENETLWVNFSLIKATIKVDIIKPLRALYIMNQRILPLSNTKIVGSLDIEAFIHNYWYSPMDAEKVEFYVDDTLSSTDTTPPYSWTWKSQGLIKHRYTIKVIAYDTDGMNASDEIIVWKFF